MAHNLSQAERERLLQQGRKLLEEKRATVGSPHSTTPVLSSSTYSTNGSYSAGIIPPSISSVVSNGVGSPVTDPSHIRTTSGSYRTKDAGNFTPLSSAPYGKEQSNYAPPSTPTNPDGPNTTPSPRDANLSNRVNELTVEKTNLMAKLFKQEKATEDLVLQNKQLRQKTEALEDLINRNNKLQEQAEDAQATIAQLQAQKDSVLEENRMFRQQLQELQAASEQYDNIQLMIDRVEEENKKLQMKLEKNAEMLQDTLSNKSQIENELVQERQRKIQVQTELQEQIRVLESELAKKDTIVQEKQQQIQILTQESSERDKDNQSSRSLILQKNETIKQQSQELLHLRNENSQLAQKVSELQTQIHQQQNQINEFNRKQEENLKHSSSLANEYESLRRENQLLRQKAQQNQNQNQNQGATSDAKKDALDSQVGAMQLLQDRIESLSQENEEKTRQLEQFNELFQQMQSNTTGQVAVYEEHIRDMEAYYTAQVQQLTGQLNALQSEAERSASTASEEVATEGDPVLEQTLLNYRKQLEELALLRESHRKQKLSDEGQAAASDSNEEAAQPTVEEMQEAKILQLLEEINHMDEILQQAPSIVNACQSSVCQSRTPGAGRALQQQLEKDKKVIGELTEENEKLLYAIESGDLQPYAELKLRQQQQREEEEKQRRWEEERQRQEQEENLRKQTLEQQQKQSAKQEAGNPKKKKGWFGWF